MLRYRCRMHRQTRPVVAALLAVAVSVVGASGPANAARGPDESAVSADSLLSSVGNSGGAVLSPRRNVLVAFTLIVPKYVSASRVQARAIIPAGVSCPKLVAMVERNGRERRVSRRMSLRTPGPTTDPAFSTIRGCQANLPKGAVSAKVGDKKVPASMPNKVNKIAMFSDTGCRIKPSEVQDCSTPATWPTARVAASIAAQRPDIIVHLGDYFYRESPCPADKQPFCGTSPPPLHGAPFNDSANGWLVDAIVPLSPMFASAPLLLTSGNHESCKRGGNGYSLLFSVFPNSSQDCAPVNGVTPEKYNPTWTLNLPVAARRTLRLAIVDTPYGDDSALDKYVGPQRPGFVNAARKTPRKRGRESWLITHAPVFGIQSTDFSNGKPSWSPWMTPDIAAASYGLLGNYDFIASSHIHLTQAVQIPGQPGQLVVGNGGVLLDPPGGYQIPGHGPLADGTGAPLSSALVPYPTAVRFWNEVRHGFVIAAPGTKSRNWKFTHRTPEGDRFAKCKLKRTKIYCG